MTDDAVVCAARLPRVVPLLLAQIRYQAHLLAGGRTILIGIGLPVILLIASSTGHGHISPDAVAGRAVFGLTIIAWATYGVRLAIAREAGILKRWRATPLPRWCYFIARILATTIVAVAAAAVTVLAGVLLYHTHVTATGALAMLIVFALGAAAWAAAATVLTSAVPSVEAASPAFTLVYFPVLIVSGGLGTIDEPHWLHTLSGYLPAEPVIHAATSALARVPGAPLVGLHDLLVLAGWCVGGLIVAVLSFRWEPGRPPRRG